MGSDTKKSDVPKPVQKFLKDSILRVLGGDSYESFCEFVQSSRSGLTSDVFTLGMPKACNNLQSFTEKFNAIEKTGKGKVNIPGHVRAAINFNTMLEYVGDKTLAPIKSGAKVKVYNLKKNEFGFTSIAVQTELTAFPEWFSTYFEVDRKMHEEKLIDTKLKNFLDAIQWEVPSAQSIGRNTVIDWD